MARGEFYSLSRESPLLLLLSGFILGVSTYICYFSLNSTVCKVRVKQIWFVVAKQIQYSNGERHPFYFSMMNLGPK